MGAGAAHPQRFPDPVDVNAFSRKRNGEMQNLEPCNGIIVLSAGNEKITGETPAGEGFAACEQVASIAALKTTAGSEPVIDAGADQPLLSTGYTAHEFLARFS